MFPDRVRICCCLALACASVWSAPSDKVCSAVLRAYRNSPERFFFWPTLPLETSTGLDPIPVEKMYEPVGETSRLFVQDSFLRRPAIVHSPEGVLFEEYNITVASLFEGHPLVPAFLSRRAIRAIVEGRTRNEIAQTLKPYLRAKNYSYAWLDQRIRQGLYRNSGDLLNSTELLPLGGVAHISGPGYNIGELEKLLDARPDLSKIYVTEGQYFDLRIDGRIQFLRPVGSKERVPPMPLSETRFRYGNTVVEFVASAYDIPPKSVDFTVANHPNESLKSDLANTLQPLKRGAFIWVIEADEVIYAPFLILRMAAATPFDLHRFDWKLAEYQNSEGYPKPLRSTLFRIEEYDPGFWEDLDWALENLIHRLGSSP